MISSLTSKEQIVYDKDELWLMKTSAQFYFKRLLYYTKPNNNNVLKGRNFFMVTYTDGIYLWEYDEEAQVYNHISMTGNEDEHSRGEMDSNGIYISSGHGKHCTYVYDMKYYMKSNQKIERIYQFPHTDMMYECFFLSTNKAVCCAKDGFLKSYELSSMTESVLNKTELPFLGSCLFTADRHIVAGSYQEILIMDEEGNLLQTHTFEGNTVRQIGEIRPNILITADQHSYSVHNITEVSAPLSFKQPVDNADYMAVIPLLSNLGDFALGGRETTSWLGQVLIKHIAEDLSISTLKYKQNIPGQYCYIEVIKELYKGTIVFGGDMGCEEICLWHYIDDLQPLCWADQTNNNVIDFLPVPII